MITLLDPQTVGQIAAGEVIERPVSVVKELVENAVDADASSIVVRMERGGFDSIEVRDDGEGMPADDLRRAVLRHATSKIRAASDLESVATLGFRGEGLASVAAVARVRLISRRRGAEIGCALDAFEESISEAQPHAAPVGTSVRARDLFANVPVRREYLRSPSAEFARVSAWVSAFALAYPRIAFSLHHDGKQVWNLPPAPAASERLSAVFGSGAAARMLELRAEGSALPGSLSGFISKPGEERGDRRLQMLFVNGRLLRSPLLAGAWNAGYATFSMVGRHPFGVLFLALPPDHVDPNVHPTKSDVRLRFSGQVFDAVRRAIAETLRAEAKASFSEAVTVSLAPQLLSGETGELFPSPNGEAPAEDSTRVLAQLANTYIVASDARSLLLVDQHAAHERIAYERIANGGRAHASEQLLIPLTLELSAQERATLEGLLGTLEESGVAIERFGESAFRLVATPPVQGNRVLDLRGLIAEFTSEPGARSVRERVWASIACHSVVRAGERLAFDEMSALIRQLLETNNPMHCPHGRPTIVRFGSEELARLFKRV